MKWNKKLPTKEGYYWLKHKWHHNDNVCKVGKCLGHFDIDIVYISVTEGVFHWGDEIDLVGKPVKDRFYAEDEWIKIQEPKEIK